MPRPPFLTVDGSPGEPGLLLMAAGEWAVGGGSPFSVRCGEVASAPAHRDKLYPQEEPHWHLTPKIQNSPWVRVGREPQTPPRQLRCLCQPPPPVAFSSSPLPFRPTSLQAVSFFMTVNIDSALFC